MHEMFLRSKGLIGEENFTKIQSKTICVIGLGGVGGTAFECLLRTGFNKFVIIDMDSVSESNLNRQILYTENDIGLSKVECAKNLAKRINNDAKVTYFNQNINEFDLKELLRLGVDYIVDAIDDVNGKIKIAKFALDNNLPFIMSLGMANRLDPSKVTTTKLNKTTNDPLAKKIRYEIKQLGLDPNSIKVVYSSENPVRDGTKLHSMMMVPSSAGLNIAYNVLYHFTEKES